MIREGLEKSDGGWYFYMKDCDCKIGPYGFEQLCREDYKRYLETGRISFDPKGKIGPMCADCEGI
jgi:hypothetical protein